MPKPYQVKDGKPFLTGGEYREECCDCALVHDVKVRTIDKDTFEHTVKRNDRATATARRKKNKTGKKK